ncbi:hypothetical protein BTJ68_09627 [Hortaea werneckii EXF-2000]|uniref:BZIP domain-containing protein n=1 Tax=Hortaea werneckii EXF-2000 TaxID=1157616 RepID=A0A1Z5T4S5_HORWE|nr:hypothetical protein BTJ68_09627 [Hortaea werneckii EXF-2000]
METMDYNYFTSNNAQPYQLMGFAQDHGLIPGIGNEGSSMNASDRIKSSSAYSNADVRVESRRIIRSTVLSFKFFRFQLIRPVTCPEQRHDAYTHALRITSRSHGVAFDLENEPHGRRSSSEEKESLTPAQSRRKAQNRAAQRAFRERKERHVRDLEAKLNLLTTTTTALQSDNERLKLLLQRAQTENEILRASNSSSPSTSKPPSFVDEPSLLSQARSPRPQSIHEPRFDTARLANGLLSTASSTPKTLSSPDSHSDSHLLSASATWDLLQSHPLYLSGAVDIGEVCERLKKMAKCDGAGPMFEEDEVRKIIEEVGRSGNDELI